MSEGRSFHIISCHCSCEDKLLAATFSNPHIQPELHPRAPFSCHDNCGVLATILIDTELGRPYCWAPGIQSEQNWGHMQRVHLSSSRSTEKLRINKNSTLGVRWAKTAKRTKDKVNYLYGTWELAGSAQCQCVREL